MNKEQILKIIKNKNNMTILIIFIIGAALMIMSGGHGAATQGKASDTRQTLAAEERLAAILSEIEGVGDVDVMITYAEDGEKKYPRALGVIITADGADNPRVKTAVHEAAMAALDVGAHRICIFKKEEE